MTLQFRKLLVLLLFILGRPSGACQAISSSDLQGQWLYYQFLYQGRSYPPTDPDLVMTLRFNSQQESWLRWTYTKSPELCERKSNFAVEDYILSNQVVWLNPENSPECGRDPDMQVGRSTTDPIEIINSELHLHLTLGGEPLILIWKKID